MTKAPHRAGLSCLGALPRVEELQPQSPWSNTGRLFEGLFFGLGGEGRKIHELRLLGAGAGFSGAGVGAGFSGVVIVRESFSSGGSG